MKPKRVKKQNDYQFMTRIPKTLFNRANGIRTKQQMVWPELLKDLLTKWCDSIEGKKK